MSQTIEADKGQSIYHAAQQAARQAAISGREVVLRFNDIDLHVSPESSPSDISVIYSLKAEIRRLSR